MDQAVILSAVRTPIGKFQGGLAPLSAPQLGAKVVAEAVRRAGVEPKSVDEIIMGNVVQAGLGQNPARQAGLGGGLDVRVAAMTINKVCGSGLKAVGLAAQSVILGEAEIVVAGGMESMSNCPYLLPGARAGYRFGNAEIVDSMVHDGLWDVYNDFHMGITAELVAEKYGITRQEQDQFALESHQRAVRARKSCFIESQIVPIEIPQKKGDPVHVPSVFGAVTVAYNVPGVQKGLRLDGATERLPHPHQHVVRAVALLGRVGERIVVGARRAEVGLVGAQRGHPLIIRAGATRATSWR